MSGISISCDNTTGDLTVTATSVDYETRRQYHFTLTIGDNAPLLFRRYSKYVSCMDQ